MVKHNVQLICIYSLDRNNEAMLLKDHNEAVRPNPNHKEKSLNTFEQREVLFVCFYFFTIGHCWLSILNMAVCTCQS